MSPSRELQTRSARKPGRRLNAIIGCLAVLGGVECGHKSGGTDGGYVCTSPDASESSDGSFVSCATYQGVVPYCPGMTAPGRNGGTFVLVSSDTQPPAQQTLETWDVQVLDKSGSAQTGTLCITGYMPQMGHGTSTTPTVTQQGDGSYQITNIDLFMPGVWQMSFALCPAGDSCGSTSGTSICLGPDGGGAATAIDTGSFTFCVQG